MGRQETVDSDGKGIMSVVLESERVLEIPMLYRQAAVSREAVKEEERTVELSFSSEDPAERWFGKEILDHAPESVRLERLKEAGPLLFNHDRDQHLGRVEGVSIEDRKGRAVVRFSKSADGEARFQDVKDGILREVSVGYMVHKMRLEEASEDEETFRVMEWEPLEISLVTIPMDMTVGVGRSHDGERTRVKVKCKQGTKIFNNNSKMSEKKITEEPSRVDVKEREAAAMTAERERCANIQILAQQHDCAELGAKAVEAGWEMERFQHAVLTTCYSAKPVAPGPVSIGLSEKEQTQYSLLRAVRTLAAGRPLDGLEREVSDETAKQIKKEPNGFFIPHEVAGHGNRDVAIALARLYPNRYGHLIRGLEAGVATAGGTTVGTDVLGSSMIELLRNAMFVNTLGAVNLTGLRGNVAIPKATGGSTAYWLDENTSVTQSAQTTGQLALTPHRLAASVFFTKQLLAQSSIDVEAFVRNDIMQVLAVEKDRAAITGDGANGEPIGIMNTTGINTTVTFGGAATWADIVAFETGVAVDNALRGSLAYLTTPAARGSWKTVDKSTSTGRFLWEGNEVNGYPAFATNQVPDDKAIFGNFEDLILADWDGIDVVVDPYSRKLTNEIEITTTIMADVGVKRPVSFNVSTDGGAQ